MSSKTDASLQPTLPPPNDFWRQKTAEELIVEQGTKPYSPGAWEGAPDVTDEELEWWLAELRQLRRDSTNRED
ncbi:MAG TPA: hypothetical protein VH120_08680 [Gemmataceae bacterium]|nr:hypothetical protein [Gemmataceae bacterium]